MTRSIHLDLSGIRFHRAVTLLCMLFLLAAGTLFGTDKTTRKVVRIPYAHFERLLVVDENNL